MPAQPAKPVGRAELRRFLRGLPKEQLVNQVIDLCESFPVVRDYYQAKVRPADDEAVREKYKRVIEREFFPPGGPAHFRLSAARQAVTDYRKLAASVEGVADVMLFYVETGVRFTHAYGDLYESFYASLERMYAVALQWIAKHGLEERLRERCAAIVHRTDDIGWGFHDELAHLYRKHFGDDGE